MPWREGSSIMMEKAVSNKPEPHLAGLLGRLAPHTSLSLSQ